MGKVERLIPLQINLFPAVPVAEVNQNLYQHAKICLENKRLDVLAYKEKRACFTDCV